MAFVEFAVVLVLLYFIGQSIYGKRTGRKFSLLVVLANFMGIMMVNAVIMSVLLAFLLVVIVGVGLALGAEDGNLIIDTQEKFATGQLLLLILIVILATAMIQFHIRKRLPARIRAMLQMNEDDCTMCEYYIQWVTIYLVVYQIVFDGFSSIIKSLVENQSIEHYFSVILSPANMNLVLKPVLIATRVVVVMETTQHSRAKAIVDGADPATPPQM